MTNQKLSDLILERAKKQRRRIAIGITRTDHPQIVESLKRAKEYADVVIVGKEIEGFRCIPIESNEAIGRKMVQMLKTGEIDQFVRGQIDDFGCVDEFKKQYEIDPKEKRLDLALLEDLKGHQFFLTMCSNPDGQTLEDKLRFADGSTEWLKSEFKIKPKVAVMACCRPGSYGRDPVMTKTYDEAEAVVKHLKEKGIEAKNVHIEIEKAVEWSANLILPARGNIGNQIFRVLYYLCGGKIYACPTLFKKDDQYIGYEDDSRNETDWFPHIVFASSWVNNRYAKI